MLCVNLVLCPVSELGAQEGWTLPLTSGCAGLVGARGRPPGNEEGWSQALSGGGGGGGEDSFPEEESPEQGLEGRVGVGCVHRPACVFEYRECILAFCLASWDAIRLD